MTLPAETKNDMPVHFSIKTTEKYLHTKRETPTAFLMFWMN